MPPRILKWPNARQFFRGIIGHIRAYENLRGEEGIVGCTEQRHVPHGGRYKIFFPPFSIILKLCIRGEDAFTPYTRSVTLILVSFLS